MKNFDFIYFQLLESALFSRSDHVLNKNLAIGIVRNMPSLRQKVTTYFRQLSFIGDSRDGPRHSGVLSPRKVDDGTFITKYLEG